MTDVDNFKDFEHDDAGLDAACTCSPPRVPPIGCGTAEQIPAATPNDQPGAHAEGRFLQPTEPRPDGPLRVAAHPTLRPPVDDRRREFHGKHGLGRGVLRRRKRTISESPRAHGPEDDGENDGASSG